jgi:integrase/recombinase XerC
VNRIRVKESPMTAHQRPLPFVPESDKWVQELKVSGKSDLTVECYSRDLRDVAQAIGGNRTSDLLLLYQTAIDAMALTWSDQGTSVATAIRRSSALRGFAVHLGRERCQDLSQLLSAKFPSAATHSAQISPMANTACGSISG